MFEHQYITDTNGQRTAVILSIEDYETILANTHFGIEEVDDPELVKAMEEAEGSPKVSREHVFEILRRR